MKNIIINKSLADLEIDKQILNKLEQNNIKSLNELWGLKRKDLKNLNFLDSEINHIRIKMQLFGIDLGKKMYI